MSHGEGAKAPAAGTETAATRQASVQLNLAANFVSFGYMILAAIVAVPLYLQALGTEAYGLIGFYTVLVSTFQVFDFGLSATLARECALYRGGAIDVLALRRVLRLFEAVFFAIALTGSLAIVSSAPVLATVWLKPEQLSLREVATAVMLAGVAIPFQWAGGLYRGALIGLERQVVLAGVTVAVVTTRSFGVLWAMSLLGANLTTFFAYQAAIAILEFLVLMILSRRFIPQAPRPTGARGQAPWGTLRFSSALAVSTVCWFSLTQGDRVILSKILSLPQYGVFTLAVTIAGVLAALPGPMSQAVLPRLTKFRAESQDQAALQLYRNATQLGCILAMPAAIVLALFADQVIWLWTGRTDLAAQAGPILRAYALGGGILSVSAFPYYLQYSQGSLRLHVIGQALLVAISLPAFFLVALRYGAVGTGLVWTGVNVAYLLLWTPVVHRRFAPGLHWRWLLQDIVPTAAASAAVAVLLSILLTWSQGRLAMMLQLVMVCAVVLLSGALASSSMRVWLNELRTHLFAAKIRRG